jgi:hypothetical protein
MPLTQITTSGIANGAVTTAQLAPGAAGGPKITQIQITNSSGTVLDDTAISLSGGYIKITGTGFAAGAQVIVNNVNALSTTFTSTTVLNAQVGPQSAGTYIVYVVNTDGGVAIAVNGLTYSSEPTWVTGSTLPSQLTAVAISIQLSATGATVYTLAAGSTLPSGLSLSSGGLLSGTINVVTETTYSFVVNAIDNELQDSPRTFSLTVNVVIADPFFYLTSLLLPGNGSNNATNNTFLDSSTNNFTVTRNGNSTQGNFSPFSQTGWSNYFDGSGDYLTVSANNFSTGGSWTIEAWCYFTNSSQSDTLVNGLASDRLYINWIGTTLYVGDAIVNNLVISNAKPINTWFHIAVVKNGSTYTAYINGTSVGSTTTALQSTTLTTWQIGARTSQSAQVALGYISNLRITTNAVYTANFTPSTTPLTAITGTTLLTCQSNRFIDNSTSNLAITRFGDTRIQAFSPFNPTIAYSAAVVGGSGYFDGSDSLSLASNAAFDFGSGEFTVEMWVYSTAAIGSTQTMLIGGVSTGFVTFRITDSALLIDRYNQALDLSGSTSNPPNTWAHVAFVRDVNTLRIYKNGVQVNSGSTTQSYNLGAPSIAAGAGLANFTGYFSGLRILKGQCLYPNGTTFAVPTAPPTAIANTSVLLNFTNDPIADATSKNVVETVGDAKISTLQSKWGGSSILFDGNGDGLAMNPTNQLLLNDFTKTGYVGTIEMWYRPIALTSPRSCLISQWLNNAGWTIDVSSGGDVFFANNSAGTPISLSTKVTTGAWHHFAVVNTGSILNIYLNGINVGTASNYSSSNPGIGQLLYVGIRSDNSLPTNGYINDLRITQGLARYTANFTPPTAAFPIQ